MPLRRRHRCRHYVNGRLPRLRTEIVTNRVLEAVASRVVGCWLISDRRVCLIDSRRSVLRCTRNSERAGTQALARPCGVICEHIDRDGFVDGAYRRIVLRDGGLIQLGEVVAGRAELSTGDKTSKCF